MTPPYLLQVLPIFLLLMTVAFPRGAPGACRETGPGGAGETVRWVSAGPDSGLLEPWCAAVGRPVLQAPEQRVAARRPADGLIVVTWNVKGGVGELERLVGDLRQGVLNDGEPVEHFALLLQEAVRVGGSVPEMPEDAASAAAIGTATDPQRSIEAVAARVGLFLFYAPSMRNGAELREDRGNAILSTLPLSDPVVIELPYERQRRAAQTARISLPLANGVRMPLRLVNAHFDNTSSRLWRSFGSGRARQARGLLEALEEGDAVVLGGDFNTWYGEADEESIGVLRERFALPAAIPDTDTYSPPYVLPRRQTDYLLASLPEGWRASYQVSRDWRDSDHAPLVGRIEPPDRETK